MANYFDRLRAAGNTGSRVMPRHKPDPRDPSLEFQDEQYATPDPEYAQALDQMDSGAGYQPTTVMGAQPTQPSVGPASTFSDRLQAMSRATPRGQQMMAGDRDFRQQQGGIDQNYQTAMLDALPPEQKSAMANAARSNPLFLAALATRMGSPGMVGMLRNYFGIRPQAPPLPAMDAPPPQPEPPPQRGLALYANANREAPPPITTPRERMAAMPPPNALAQYQR